MAREREKEVAEPFLHFQNYYFM